MSRLCSIVVGLALVGMLVGTGLAGDLGQKPKKAKDYPFAVAPREAFAILADPEALAVLKSRSDLIRDAKKTRALGAMVYDQWARSKKKEGWKSALEVYASGLKTYPDDSLLTQNAVATIDAQGVPLMNANQWTEAVEVFETGLKYVPGNKNLEQRLKTCKMRLQK